jgi:4-hydroxybenzoate polyprenyltransferase
MKTTLGKMNKVRWSFWKETIIRYGRMIKFSHTVFALPFALAAVILAQRETSLTLLQFFWILLAMVAARSAAMGFNRIVDAPVDRKNPRTATREIPAGNLTIYSAWTFVLISSAAFILAAAMLGHLCFILSFPFLFIILFYSYTKRFTWFCHIYLGFAISLAPLGVWIALTNSLSWQVFLLCLALMTYIAGFDILYACQDFQFDRNEGLCSIPARYGVKNALRFSSGLHFFSFCCFLAMHVAFGMNKVFLIAVLIIGGLFLFERLLVTPSDLKRVPIAFFHMNSLVSITLLCGVLADEMVRRLW